MRQAAVALALAALISVSGCGNMAATYTPIVSAVSTFTTRNDPQPDIRVVIAQAAPELPTARFIELPDRGVLQNRPRLASQGILVREEIVGDVATWQDANRTTMNFRQGVLISTRGLGGDLMSANVDEVLAGVYGGAAQAVRVHRTLGGEDQLLLNTFVCDYSRGPGTMTDPLLGPQAALVVVEDCIDSMGTQFENRYWIDAGGVIRQSTQWISADVGRLITVLVKG